MNSDVFGFLTAAAFNAGLAAAAVIGQLTDPTTTAQGTVAWVIAGSSAVNAGVFVVVARGFLNGTIAHRSSVDAESKLHSALSDANEREDAHRRLVNRFMEER